MAYLILSAEPYFLVNSIKPKEIYNQDSKGASIHVVLHINVIWEDNILCLYQILYRNYFCIFYRKRIPYREDCVQFNIILFLLVFVNLLRHLEDVLQEITWNQPYDHYFLLSIWMKPLPNKEASSIKIPKVNLHLFPFAFQLQNIISNNMGVYKYKILYNMVYQNYSKE